MNWTKTYKKAVTFSYDDGVTPDLKLLEISTNTVSSVPST